MMKKENKNKNIKKAVEIEIYHDQPMVSSLALAEHFGKRHGNVLQAIERLECSNQFNALNFKFVEYTDAKGESRPAVNMTRDGFSILAMGFTGKKAMAWKEKYIAAFNAMESRLRFPAVETKHKLCPADQHELRAFKGLAKYWCYLEGIPWTAGKAQIEAMLKIPDLNFANALEMQNAWTVLRINMVIVPRDDEGPLCSEEDLEPINGLFDYWAHNVDTPREELVDSICAQMAISSLNKLGKAYVPHALSLIWDNINHKAGERSALKKNRT